MLRHEFDRGMKYAVEGLNGRMPPEGTLEIWHSMLRRVPQGEWMKACRRMVKSEHGFPRGFLKAMRENYLDQQYITPKEDHKPLTPEEVREAHRCAPAIANMLKVYSDAKLGPMEMRRMERFLGMTLADMHRNPEQELPMNSDFVSKHLGKKSVQEWMNHYLTNPTEIDYVGFPYELMYYREADVPSEDIIEDAVEESAAAHAVVDEDDFDFDGEF